jgi:hypothetical protein
MPTHQAGDILLVFVMAESAAGGSDLTASAGWSQVAQAYGLGGNPPRLALFTKKAANSSQSITITNTNDRQTIAHVYALEFASGTVAATGASSADPPSLTAPWGYASTLWLVACYGSSGTPLIPPAGWGDAVQTSANNRSLTTADKADSSATLDPATFTGSGGVVTLTAAVQPA